MSKFQVGDTVRVDDRYSFSRELRGKTGIVVKVDVSPYDICVDFGAVYDGTHNCAGRIPKPTGRYFDDREVHLVSYAEPESEPDIVLDPAAFEDFL